MVVNLGEVEIAKRAEALRRTPVWASLLDWAAQSPLPLRLVAESPHLELAGTSPVEGRPNRGLLKVFNVSGKRWAAFFYKKSQVPSSRDRFAYGAAMFEEGRLQRGAAEGWFAWLDCGFDPLKAPPHLKRAFSFTVPE